MNGGVSFSATSCDSDTKTSWPVAVCADALKGRGVLEEQRRQKHPISVEAHRGVVAGA
jgi:hypothetical protein